MSKDRNNNPILNQTKTRDWATFANSKKKRYKSRNRN